MKTGFILFYSFMTFLAYLSLFYSSGVGIAYACTNNWKKSHQLKNIKKRKKKIKAKNVVFIKKNNANTHKRFV